jgi:hypothetical protein
VSTIKVSAIQDLSGGQNVDVPNAAKAWVNFNGTGTVAIRESGNVSSITDNGTGNYTVNFTTAMEDVNYCVSTDSVGGDSFGVAAPFDIPGTAAYSTTSFRCQSRTLGNSNQDVVGYLVAIFR